ncbi:unnamed protein product [Malus baccata var. baccata]
MASTLTSTSTSCPSDHLGWASVPLDVLFVILNKLSEYVDHVRVAGVFKGWRSIAKLYNNSTQRWHRVLPPMLLFPENSKGKSRNIHSRTKMRGVLYGVSEGKTYENIQLSLPSLISRTKTKRYFFGCGHGWLAQVEHRPQCHITLLNPFRKFESVSLPPLDIDAGSFAPQKVKNIKVILSAVPNLNRDNYVVVAFSMYGKNRIAFFKGGQKDWTYTFGPYRFIDAIFCKGDLYAVECSGSTLRVSVFNVQSIFAKKAHSWQKPMARLVIETPRFSRFGYLVESTLGNLFYIQKRWRPENGRIPRNDKRPPAKTSYVSDYADWASLPQEVVFFILDKVLEPLDQVFVAAVCKEWRSVAKDHNNSMQRWRPKFEVVSLPPLPRLGSFLSRKNDNQSQPEISRACAKVNWRS